MKIHKQLLKAIQLPKCKNCKQILIKKKRTNYPHGRYSGAITATYCKNCGVYIPN